MGRVGCDLGNDAMLGFQFERGRVVPEIDSNEPKARMVDRTANAHELDGQVTARAY